MSEKYWSDEEKIDLFKLILKEGTKWVTIASIMNSTPDAVRNIYRRTNWTELLDKHNLTFLLNKNIDQFVYDEENKEYIEEEVQNLIDATKSKINKELESRKIQEHLNQIAKEDLIYEKIIGSISQIKPITPKEIIIPKPKFNTSPQESVLLVSDVHVGLAVLPEEVGGMGSYSVEIFRKRLRNLIQTVCHITDLHRQNHKLETINVCLLGDIVHGGNDAGQWGFLHSEQNIMDQIFEAMREFQIALITLRQKYSNVNVYCVYGNHGRVAKRNVEKKFVNWDYLIYKWLEASLAHQQGIKFSIPRANFNIAEIMNKKILLVHGDQARSWCGIPWYGLSRLESKYRSIIDRSKNLNKMWDDIYKNNIDTSNVEQVSKFIFNYVRSFDYMALGHFHSAGEVETTSGGRIILNSSFIGGDDYSISDLVSASEPMQKFFGINDERKTWSYDISLERE
jgi:hypothetical protein